ncbi:hypothetical protein EVB78_102 [Rhizobium phage RHph_N1_15]|nr:hypothetical protein EVB77_102 [Rhizobium phage RHph_N1_10]QIG69304.1 hypothetical protein EVB78_102 [Rhizobium phage RHph_N1_15]QIG75164.1 hypothetical protein EVC15_102 [Rhizobium phage RHph_N2_6]
MSGLDIVGAGTLYIVSVGALGYLVMILIAFICHKGGLEVIPFIVIPPVLIWVIGAIVGLVLLGRMLA